MKDFSREGLASGEGSEAVRAKKKDARKPW